MPVAEIALLPVPLRTDQIRQRQHKDSRHFVRAGGKARSPGNDANHRLDDKSDRARNLPETADNLDPFCRQRNFLARLSKRCIDESSVAILNLAAGKTDLAGVMGKMRGPFGHDDVPPRITLHQPDQHRRRSAGLHIEPRRDRIEH